MRLHRIHVTDPIHITPDERFFVRNEKLGAIGVDLGHVRRPIPLANALEASRRARPYPVAAQPARRVRRVRVANTMAPAAPAAVAAARPPR